MTLTPQKWILPSIKIKWDIGDIVVTVDREYAVNMNERIVETTETFDENGYSISPTFGTTQKTILGKNLRYFHHFYAVGRGDSGNKRRRWKNTSDDDKYRWTFDCNL